MMSRAAPGLVRFRAQGLTRAQATPSWGWKGYRGTRLKLELWGPFGSTGSNRPSWLRLAPVDPVDGGGLSAMCTSESTESPLHDLEVDPFHCCLLLVHCPEYG